MAEIAMAAVKLVTPPARQRAFPCLAQAVSKILQ